MIAALLTSAGALVGAAVWAGWSSRAFSRDVDKLKAEGMAFEAERDADLAELDELQQQYDQLMAEIDVEEVSQQLAGTEENLDLIPYTDDADDHQENYVLDIHPFADWTKLAMRGRSVRMGRVNVMSRVGGAVVVVDPGKDLQRIMARARAMKTLKTSL